MEYLNLVIVSYGCFKAFRKKKSAVEEAQFNDNIKKILHGQWFSFSRLGGPDPLDYISMYRNMGCPAQDVQEHWHYVSFGLSDLYGDNRVHE